MASLQKRKIKGNYYWYVVESKRINGKPTPVVIAYLGSIENIVAKFSQNTGENLSCRSYMHGAAFALWQIALKYNLPGIIDTIVPGRKRFGLTKGQLIIVDCIYKYLCNVEGMDISIWISSTTLPMLLNINLDGFNNSTLSKIISDVDFNTILLIEKALYHSVLSDLEISSSNIEYTCGSFFRFFTNIHPLSMNRQNKAQMSNDNYVNYHSLSTLMIKNNPLPFFSFINQYALNSTHSSKGIDDFLIDLNLLNSSKSITMIFDRPSISTGITEIIKKYNFNIICSVPLNTLKEICRIPLRDYKPLVSSGSAYSYFKIQKLISGYKYNIIIYYNQKDYNRQMRRLDREVLEKIELLENLRTQLSDPYTGLSAKRSSIEKEIQSIIGDHPFNTIFNVLLIGKQKIKDLKYSINQKIYDDLSTTFYGKKVLITNNLHWTAEEVLDAYLGQSGINRLFRNSKRQWRISPAKDSSYNPKMLKAHTFTCLLGLTLAELLRKELTRRGATSSLDNIINTLSNIRQTILISNKDTTHCNEKSEVTLINEMNDSEKLLWDKVLDVFSMGPGA